MGWFSKTSGNKVNAVQELRGVAVLLVLLVHAINVVDTRVYLGVDTDRGRISTFLAINEFGACGVDLFFVISGFVMALLLDRPHPESRTQFLAKRFLRIVPLFWLAALAFAVATLAVGRTITPGLLLAALTIIPPNPFHYEWPVLVVGWSLGFELAFYAAVTLVLHRRRAKTKLAIMIILLGIGSWVLRVPPGTFSVFANPIQLEFLWGIAAYTLWRLLDRRRSGWLIGMALFVVGGYLLAVQAAYGLSFFPDYMQIISAHTSLPRALLWGLPWAMIAMGYILFEPRMSSDHAPIRSLLQVTGEGSYALYLTHMTICLFFETLIPPQAVPADLLILGIIASAWLTGIAAHFAVEKPLLKKLGTMSSSSMRIRNRLSLPAR